MRSTSDTPTERVCPHCGNPFPTITIPPMFGAPERRVPCPCECEGALAEELERKRFERKNQLRHAWEATEVPKRYRDVEPDKELLGVIESGRGLYLCGPKGTGKTTAACAALKAYVAKHTDRSTGWCSARFIQTSEWLDSIQETYGNYRLSSEDAFWRAAGVGLLVLDDIGKVNSRITDWTVGKLFRLVDERYGEGKPTVFTSQYDLSDLSRRLTVNGDADTADAIVSRIFETCDQRLYDGPDRRLVGSDGG